MKTRKVQTTALVLAALLAAALAGAGCSKSDNPGAAAAEAPETITTKTGVQMVRIPGGWFTMGSDDALANEAPAHRVWVDALLMDAREVTQDQFRLMSMPDPSHFKGPQRPVEQVTIADAMEYCNERSIAEDLAPCYVRDEQAGTWTCDFAASGYRLPTEAEWEYACRAGTTTKRFFGPDKQQALPRYAWYAANSVKRTHPVAQKKPNPWGLYDMYGNVAEWCQDTYDAEYYKVSAERNPRGPDQGKAIVLRGGAWDSREDPCRSAWRAGENPRFHDICFAKDTIGFRCVRRAPKRDD